MFSQQTFGFLDLPSIDSRPLAPSTASEADSPSKAEKPAKQNRPNDRQSVLSDLRSRVGCINTALKESCSPVLSTGSEAINGLLPRGGLRQDAIAEWVAQADGGGAAALAMITAALHLQSAPGPLVIVTGERVSNEHVHKMSAFYPPAAITLGVPVERIVLVRVKRSADMVWAIDQSLRCESVAAVWAHVGENLEREALNQVANLLQETICPLVSIESLDRKPWAGSPRHQCESIFCDITGVTHLLDADQPGAW